VAGERRPANPGEVARAIVAVANEAGLILPADDLLRAEEICGELPGRAVAVQAFVVIATRVLVERYGGVRALARAMAGKKGGDRESTVRRCLVLGRSETKSIIELNRIVSRLSKFSRSEIRKSSRRIRTESTPAGDRQAVLAHISLLYGAVKPIVPTMEETLALPVVLVVAELLTPLARLIAEVLGTSKLHAPSANSAGSAG
jgi:hypothetical protein